jgi:hypothetical protein
MIAEFMTKADGAEDCRNYRFAGAAILIRATKSSVVSEFMCL